MEETLRAYLAGCIDCDGSIGIKKSTYHMRVRCDAGAPVYSERVMFAQVKPEVPMLMKQCFGGNYHVQKPGTVNSKPVYKWYVTDKNAIRCIEAILPYLRIKKNQADILLKLRELKNKPKIATGKTFIIHSRWGNPVNMPVRIVDPVVLQNKEILFNEIKSLNDVRVNQPQLIGIGLSGEEVKPKRKHH